MVLLFVYIIIAVLHILFLTTHGKNTITGFHVCMNSSMGVRFCCFNYEEYQGRCIPCKTGYTSRNGFPCTTCEEGYYGIRCLFKCKCTDKKRCHNIFGCVEDDFSIVSTSVDATETTYIQTSPWPLSNHSNKTGPAFKKEVICSGHIPYFTLTTGIIFACMVIYIIVSNTVCFMMYTKIKKNQQILTPVPVNLYDEIETVPYQEVSQPPVINPDPELVLHHPIQLLPTLESDMISESSINDGNVHSSYSGNSQIISIDSENEGHQQGTVDMVVQNEHSYVPLLPPRENGHQYEKCSFLNDNNDESQQGMAVSPEHYIDMGI